MDQQNPYAAPQIAEFATPIMMDGEWTPEKALGPEWRTVCAGAKKCYTALIILILGVVLMVLLGIVATTSRSMGGVALMGISMFVVFLTVWVFQLLGQIQLNKVSQASGAKGVINASLITFIVYSAGTLLLMIVGWLFIASEVANAGPSGPRMATFPGMGGPNAGGVIGIAQWALNITQWACSILLLLGLRRIGTALKNSSIVNNATIALVLYGAFVVFGLVVALFATQVVQSGQGMAQSNSGLPMFAALFGFGALIGGLVLLVVYSNALKKIADYAKSPQWMNT